MAKWLRHLILDQKVWDSIPCSNLLYSCYSACGRRLKQSHEVYFHCLPPHLSDETLNKPKWCRLVKLNTFLILVEHSDVEFKLRCRLSLTGIFQIWNIIQIDGIHQIWTCFGHMFDLHVILNIGLIDLTWPFYKNSMYLYVKTFSQISYSFDTELATHCDL